jgi:hypothetical protein
MQGREKEQGERGRERGDRKREGSGKQRTSLRNSPPFLFIQVSCHHFFNYENERGIGEMDKKVRKIDKQNLRERVCKRMI